MESKPGWKTSEFWLSLAAMVVGALLAAGVFADNSLPLKILGVVSSILGALGYTASRAWVKGSEAKAAAFIGVANPPKPPQP